MKKAFSLAELLIVLAVMSMVVGTMKVHVHHKRIQADAKAIVECMKIYRSVITMYYLQHDGTFPPDSNGKKLEEVDALAPYCPPGFKTLDNANINGLEGISIAGGSSYGIRVSLSVEELIIEVRKQLETFTVNGQLSTVCTQCSCITYLFLGRGDVAYI